MADHSVTKPCERESSSFVDLLAFIDAIESGELDSAHAILLAWQTQSCNPDCSSLIPGLLENRQYKSRLLPLLQRWVVARTDVDCARESVEIALRPRALQVGVCVHQQQLLRRLLRLC